MFELIKGTMKTVLILFVMLSLNFPGHFQVQEENKNAGKIETELIMNKIPVFINTSENILFSIKLNVNAEQKVLKKIVLHFTDESSLELVSAVSASILSDKETLFGKTVRLTKSTVIEGNYSFVTVDNSIQFNFSANKNTSLQNTFCLKNAELHFADGEIVVVSATGQFKYRGAIILRSRGQDNCDTYRIPGLITTGNGTLVAVYDVRYNNSKDLQEDIDIGMSRSTDGGQSWEPMKIIMDMGEWGGRPEKLNGIGDPCVLYDPETNTIWVAALWMSGGSEKDALWWTSKPGMKPDETGQFMLVKSTDNGLTWSEPINITSQIKEPGWQLLLQGPGRGISMKDGTLVFPAQFKADTGTKSLDGGKFTCHSTIVYSKDHGKTWQIGTGAKPNTTESQVVELADGSLMLNMRDDLNRTDKSEKNGRAVAITSDMGKTWTTHKSSNSALQEPNCMASLISADIELNGKLQQVLFFSNPNNKTERSNMTIKSSLDGGLTWPIKYQTEINSKIGYGYSCMTMIDGKTIGIVYEGEKDLYFQKIPVSDLLGDQIK